MLGRSNVKRSDINSSRWVCFKKSFKYSWGEFGDASSIHGMRYLCEPNCPAIQSLIWSIILLLSSVIVSVFVYYLWLRYMETPTKTTIKSQHIPSSNILFPAITICPSSIILTEKVDYFLNFYSPNLKAKFNQNADDNRIYRAIVQSIELDHNIASLEDMELLEEFLRISNLEFFNLLQNVSLSCKDFLSKCRFDYKSVDCHHLFVDLLTSNGLCCSFNYDLRKNRKVHSSGFGLFSGLDIIIKSGLFSDVGENIFRLYIHDFLTFPTTSIDNFLIAERRETSVPINMEFISSDTNLRELSPNDRKCVFKNEYKLTYFSSFTYENCISECQLERFSEICGCVPHYFRLITKGTFNFCTPTKYLCIKKHFQEVLNIQASKSFAAACKCPLECDLLMIDVRLLQWDYQLSNLSVNPFYAGISADDTVLHIYHARSCVVELTKVLSLRGITFTSNLGGLISFFMGFSFISILEIFYFLGYRLFKRYKQMQSDSKIFFMSHNYFNFYKDFEYKK